MAQVPATWIIRQSCGVTPQGSIAPDLNGHGKTPGEGRTTIKDYADDMLALLDALEIEQCIAVGHSMGGAIAQTLALHYTCAPCRDDSHRNRGETTR